MCDRIALVFEMRAIIELAELTRIAIAHSPLASLLEESPGLLVDGQVDLARVDGHLQLVVHEADGVYLRSSARDGSAVGRRVYAQGFDPRTWPCWRDAPEATVLLKGGPHAEVVPLAWVEYAARAQPLGLVFTLSLDDEEYRVALPGGQGGA